MDGFLKSVRIQNYRCVKDATLELGPLTVLAGPNASGKSTILRALDAGTGISWADKRHRDNSCELRVTWHVQAGSGVRLGSTWLAANAGGVGATGERIRSQAHRFDVEKIREPVVPEEQRAVSRTGEGLANALYSLPRDEQYELSKRFCQLVTAFSDVEAKTHEQYAGRGNHTLLFRDRWKKDFVFTPAEVSDGSLLLLALLLIPFQLEPVDLVLIDEPETSLHPYLLENLVNMFRSLANGTLGRRPIQVVLATHSPTLLNFVDPSEVRFLTRSKEDGSTVIQPAPLDNPDWPRIFSDFDKELGSIWLTGGMGGVPGRS